MTVDGILRRIKNLIFNHKKRRQIKNYFSLHGICDNSGGDFKEYFFNEDMPRVIAELKRGLDSKSCELVDLSIE
ncbi:MAG: hypothetical protein WC082_12860, partial [Victivallales bacterium]